MPKVIDFSRETLMKIFNELNESSNEIERVLDEVDDDMLEIRREKLVHLINKINDVLEPPANNNNNNNNNANSVASVRRVRAEASIEDPINVYPNVLEGNVRRRRKSRKNRTNRRA